ncbi:hypothetical protein [Pseudooceanicola sp. 200-1SW]|uniref:hypothetical protein n=1 Tax=Pseudooceanicola sp. 200-1SW TaxID=3425949 RepID=UPI003D7F566A
MLRPLSQVSLIALMTALPFVAQADVPGACSPYPTDDDDVVTCSGTGPGFTEKNLDGLSVTVTAGAVIRDDGKEAIRGGEDLRVTNHGTITSDDGSALRGDDEFYLKNEGLITSSADKGVEADDFSEVINNGTITSTLWDYDDEEEEWVGADAVQVGDDSKVTNRGTLSGTDEGVQVGDDSTVHNYGTITGTDRGVDSKEETWIYNYADGVITGTTGDGVRVDGDGGLVVNHGKIYAGDDGVQVGDDGEVRNYGLIDSDDKGIQADDDAKILNEGTILSDDEGIEAGDDAEITNAGTITALDDAINAGENAMITNALGGVLTATGAQDGIDIDSGTVLNYGLIQSLGGEDGIDFDASEVATSTITNHGTISGKIGVNVELGLDDPANTMSQVVINHGTIIGTSGTALQLGAGDDTLDIYSMDIQGTVDLGTGEDTLIVRETVEEGVVYFASDVEIVDLDEAPETAVYGDMTLVVGPRGVFGAMDGLSARRTAQMGKSALMPMAGNPAPAPALGFAAGGMDQGGWWGSGSASVFDGQGAGRLTVGRDYDRLGVFVSYGRTTGEAGGGYDLTEDSTMIGLHTGRALAGGGDLVGIAYLGFAETDLSGGVSGKGSVDSRIFGLAGAVTSAATPGGLSVTARAGIEHQSFDSFTLSGLGGARYAARDVTTGFLSAEARLTRSLPGGGTITPFLGAEVLFTDGEAVTLGLGSGTARYATEGDDTLGQLTLGVELEAASQPWRLRIEGQYDAHEKSGVQVTAGMRF